MEGGAISSASSRRGMWRTPSLLFFLTLTPLGGKKTSSAFISLTSEVQAKETLGLLPLDALEVMFLYPGQEITTIDGLSKVRLSNQCITMDTCEGNRIFTLFLIKNIKVAMFSRQDI